MDAALVREALRMWSFQLKAGERMEGWDRVAAHLKTLFPRDAEAMDTTGFSVFRRFRVLKKATRESMTLSDDQWRLLDLLKRGNDFRWSADAALYSMSQLEYLREVEQTLCMGTAAKRLGKRKVTQISALLDDESPRSVKCDEQREALW